MTTKEKSRGWKSQAVRDYVKRNPTAGHRQFVEETGINVTDAVFYTQRKKMNGGVSPEPGKNGNSLIPPDFIVQGKLRKKYDVLAEYIRENPEATFSVMSKDTGLKLCNSTFSRFKKRCLSYWARSSGSPKAAPRYHSSPSSRSSKKRIYQPIFVVDSTNLSDKAIGLLKQFVESLNESKVGRYEVREYRDPRELEVREVQ